MHEVQSDSGALLNGSSLSSQALVALAQSGDRAAFSKLVLRYHKRVYNMLYGLVGQADEADDLAQETFVRAYRALERFQNRSQFYTWLYQIAMNCFRDWHKSARRYREVSAHHTHQEEWKGFESFFIDPHSADDHVQSREFQALLKCALAQLQPEYRETIVLRDIEGLTYSEIAEILGCATGTVKSRLSRARSHLKELWETKYKTVWEGDIA